MLLNIRLKHSVYFGLENYIRDCLYCFKNITMGKTFYFRRFCFVVTFYFFKIIHWVGIWLFINSAAVVWVLSTEIQYGMKFAFYFSKVDTFNYTQLVTNKKGLVVLVVSLSFKMIEWTRSLVFFVRVRVELETLSILLIFHWVCVLRASSVGDCHPQRIHFFLSEWVSTASDYFFVILCQLAGRPIFAVESLVIKDLRCLCQPQISSNCRWSYTVSVLVHFNHQFTK